MFLAASTLLALGLLAGAPHATAAPEAGKTIEKIKADGRLIVGIGQEAAPFGYRENGQLVGYDVDIVRAVAKRLETYIGSPISLQFMAVTDETRISWVQSGQVHMSLSHTNITRKRLANIDFSVPYGWDGKSILYRNTKPPRDLADFAGKTIGIKRSSSAEGEIKAYFESKGLAPPVLKQYDNHGAGIRALLDQQIDGFTDDSSLIIATATLSGSKVGPDGPLSVAATSYSTAMFGIGVPQDDSRWRNIVNYALHDLWLSGEFQRIYAKWFGPASVCPLPLGDHRMEPFVNG